MLSTAAAQLHSEVIETILSALVDFYDHDPTYQWTTLQLSPHRKRGIEQDFRNFWLAHVSVTVYCNAWDNTDFDFESVGGNPESGQSESEKAAFVFQGWRSYTKPERNTKKLLTDSWGRYSFENRNATIRLGEGVLNNGFAGGYILNDTFLPWLEFDESGETVKFCWKEAANELMREEMFLRRITPKLLDKYLPEYLEPGKQLGDLTTMPC